MKKLFLAIYFILSVSSLRQAFAGVSTVEEAEISGAEPRAVANQSIEGLPDPNNLDEVRAFFKQRFQNANVSQSTDLGDLNKSNSMDVQHSAEYIQSLQENQKSTFEKIYDQVMGRLDEPQEVFSSDTVFYELVKEQHSTNDENIPNIALVNVKLPNGEQVLAPAREHVPYLLVSYNILPTGLIDVREDIIVVANGEKLKHGLIKLMPKFTTSRSSVKKKIDFELVSVSINDKEIAYKVEEIGDNIKISPKQTYTLEPGVYHYRLHYLLDRKLWYYDDFTEFYTNVSGSYLNLVIASANAIVSVVEGGQFISQTALTGFAKDLTSSNVLVASLAQNALGFASLNPLRAGEGMHILVGLDKNVFIQPGFGRRLSWFVTDYGDILFALLGFLAVFGAYFLSWKGIQKNKFRFKLPFKQTAAFNRYLLENVYDKRSFVSAFLDLYRAKKIDIQKQGRKIVLIKKTDKLNGLSFGLKKVMKNLFLKNDSAIEVSSINALKFHRAEKTYGKYLSRLIKFMSLRVNMLYLFFSSLMLFFVVFAIAYIALNPVETGLILMAGVVVLSFYLWILSHQFSNKAKLYLFKGTAILFVIFTMLFLSVYIHLLAALLIGLTIWVIIKYSNLFGTKEGLIKSKINEIENLRNHLKVNSLVVSKGIEFEMQQANIFAFQMEEEYLKNVDKQKNNKLNLVAEILKTI